jgi:hypothetical protein
LFYFDPIVQLAMNREIDQVMGCENKDDARQQAYLAIADESPLTVEDACICARRAIDRYKKGIIKRSKIEISFDELDPRIYQSYYGDDCDSIGSDYEPRKPSRIDREQPDTENPPRHGPAYFRKQYAETVKENGNREAR